MEILIKNQQKIINLNLIKKQKNILKILELLGMDEKIEVSIFFTDDEMIRELNHKYREINKPTDVLSFAFEDDEDSFPLVGENRILGDIIISVETARRNAQEANHSLEWEINILILHGLLHLLGYDHLKDKDYELMHKKELEILNKMKSMQISQ